jgi:Cd2+/Zn2+-exporting ATPase
MTADWIRLDLPVVLPEVADARDRCVSMLLDALAVRQGVSRTHVVEADGQVPQLCVHFDPAALSVERVRELAAAVGADLQARVGHFIGRLPTALHARAAARLRERIRQSPGILTSDVSPAGAVRVEFDRTAVSAAAVRDRLLGLGVELLPAAERAPLSLGPLAASASERAATVDDPVPASDAAERSRGPEKHDHGAFGERTELAFAALAGILLLAGWLGGRFFAAPPWLSQTAYVLAYLFGGAFTFREAIENVRAKRFEIDLLMLVAAVGAAALGEWAEGALLLFLFSLGHALEHWAMGRARRAIEALGEIAPTRALVKRGEATEEIPVERLVPGDVVIVRPHERLPADGIVSAGTSSVDQSPITGESVPVDKRAASNAAAAAPRFDRAPPEHRVFAGTINGAGALEVYVARPARDTTLARVVRTVTEAEAQRSPTQRFTARFERVFVPCVFGLVVVLLIGGYLLEEPFAVSFYRAMAVLVAASPCALAISVPSAVLSAIARAGRAGLLVKGGGPLENLGALKAIAFDKTGTLTEGKPRLTDVHVSADSSEAELLEVALALERRNEHPLATAIVTAARERLRDASERIADAVESVTGRGLRGTVDGRSVEIGKPVWFQERPIIAPPAELMEANDRLVAAGRTTMLVRWGDRYLGVLGVMDTPRPGAAAVVRRLRELGIERMVMISGDNQRVADAVAASVGIDEARGDLLPDDKVAAIRGLREETGRVAMVGDGVNDAPAMASATVGIAMGAAGSDVALETADVALMGDDLTKLPLAVALSRATRRVILQNVWISLGVVALLIPATIFGLGIGVAVLFHEGSTLIVVANALRLLSFRDRGA